jgi:hypothetical protein
MKVPVTTVTIPSPYPSSGLLVSNFPIFCEKQADTFVYCVPSSQQKYQINDKNNIYKRKF